MNIDLSGHKLEIECPKCGGPVKFTLDQAGDSIVCPACRAVIELIGEDAGSIEGRLVEKKGGTVRR